MQNQTFDKLRPTNVLLFKSTSVSKLDLPTDFKNCIWLDHFLIGTDFAVAIYSSIPGDSLKYCGMVILSDSKGEISSGNLFPNHHFFTLLQISKVF